MDERFELRREIVSIQQIDGGPRFKINERNAADLVKRLMDKGKIDGVFTQTGDFLTMVSVYSAVNSCV